MTRLVRFSSSWNSLLLLLPSLLCWSSGTVRAGNQCRTRNAASLWTPRIRTRPWGLVATSSCRGGGDTTQSENDDSSYTAVGILPLDDSEETTYPIQSWLDQLVHQAVSSRQAHMVLLTPSHRRVAASVPCDPAMAETLGMTCNIIVVCVKDGGRSHSELISRIVEGAKRQQQHGGRQKVKLVVVFAERDDRDEDTMRELQTQIAMRDDLKNINPQYFASMDVVELSQLENVLKELVEDPPLREEQLIESEGFGSLVEQVYRALSFQQCTIHWEVAVPFKDRPSDASQVDAVDNTDTVHFVMQQAHNRLDELESKQQEVWLHPGTYVPLLEFGAHANAILEQASRALLHNHEKRRDVLSRLVSGKLKQLYDQQLESLREHYGRQYERALEATSDQQEWTEAAQKATENFRAAAHVAIPDLCREGNELGDAGNYSYVNELQGLVSDMMDATSLREGYVDAAMGSEEDEGGETLAKRTLKWYERLAARAVVLGINYLQGWLAWQGIRRAAVERDRDMPKFPLF